MKHVFLDSDVLLDQLANRQPFQREAAEVLSLICFGSLLGYTSPLVIANVQYILRRFGGDKTARENIGNMLGYVHILPVEEATVKAALQSSFADFEDALQHETALLSGKVEVILTRNLKDYKKAKLPVLTPEKFLAILHP